MFDFSTEVDRHGTGAPNGIMSPTGLVQPTCYHSPSQIWICHRTMHSPALTQRLSHGVLGYSRWKMMIFGGN